MMILKQTRIVLAIIISLIAIMDNDSGTFKISLMPKQIRLKQLIETSDYEIIGYGGARGGAKSHAIRDLAVLFGLQFNVPIMIFRRYRQQLLDNHVYPLLKKYPSLRRYFNKQELILFHPNTGMPMITFGYAEYERDIETLAQGKEWALIFVDEATQSTQGMIEFLSTANRDPKGMFPTKPKMVLTMNPGGIGHSYVKRVFIDRIYRDNEDANIYAFIQAHVWDNVFWVYSQLRAEGYSINDYYKKWNEQQRMDYCLKHSDYAKKLSYLPEDMRKAHLYGDWDVYGGMFFKTFDQRRQIIQPFEIDQHWSFIGSFDPGYASPCSFGLLTRDFAGNIYRIATYYEAQTRPKDHAKNIRQFCLSPPVRKYTLGRIPPVVVSGHDAWAKQDRFSVTSNELTFKDLMEEQGFNLVKANTSRIQGWWAMKNLFPDTKNLQDFGHFFVFDIFNKPFIDEMISVESDEKNPEDIKGKGNDPTVSDHSLDENRYGVMYLEIAVHPEIEQSQTKFVAQEDTYSRINTEPIDASEYWRQYE